MLDPNEISAPKISIISVTLNDVSGLRETMQSLVVQSTRDFEYVVVDGGSTDETVAWLESAHDVPVQWISEPDAGISDAFNKGVQLSGGEWILFLGAGDCLADPDVVQNVIQFIQHAGCPAFFYGDVIYEYENSKRLVHQNYSMQRFCRYSCIPHQGMFLHRRFFEEYGWFDLHYSVCMDYEHTARFIREHEPVYMELIVARMPRTGVSTDPWRAHREMNRVRAQHSLASPLVIMLSWIPVYLKAAYCFVFRRPW